MLRELKGGTATHQARTRHRRKRFAWNLFLWLLFLTLIGLVVAFALVWYMGRNNPVTVKTVPAPVKTPSVTKPKISDNAPVGVVIESMTPSVKPGGNASISVKTRPDAACSIKVTYANDVTSKDAGLMPKTADEFGVVMWTWSVTTDIPVGAWPVEISCAYNGHSGYGKETLNVKND